MQPGLPVWPGDPPVEMESAASILQGDSCNVTTYRMSSHTGTHLDPPRHFFPDGAPLDALPLSLLIGLCYVADLSSEMEESRRITPDLLDGAGIPPETSRLLLKTPNSRLWENPCHAFEPNFIDLSPDGARWVIERGIRLIGIDYLSIEGPHDPSCPVHRSLLSAPVVILEGLDLREVSGGAYHLVCLPLRAMNGDGAPARALLLREG
ncbi:MAG: cyclase family protein [Armatimonadetes bacterium]|nr:cyclase family protein [Armatimonadota bacterium]